MSSHAVYVSTAAPFVADDDVELDDERGTAGTHEFTVDPVRAGERLDKALAEWLPEVSRSRIKQWIEAGRVRVNGHPVRPRHALIAGDRIDVEPQPAPEAAAFAPEPMELAIVHEDASIIVLDKPAGLVVHPAAGHWSGTLLNGLLARFPELASVPRAGIVHRLDAGTTGLMVVARDVAAHVELVRQLQARTVQRDYWAIVLGRTRPHGVIDAAIARDPRNPLRFRVSRAASARSARTRYLRLAVAEQAGAALSWLACRLDTGRTHQIRVHLEHLGHPLVGDPVYRRRLPPPASEVPWRAFPRQALHACRLGLVHPQTGSPMQWFRTPPADLAQLMHGVGFGPLDEPSAAPPL